MPQPPLDAPSKPDAATELRLLRNEAHQIRELLVTIEGRTRALTRKIASGVILAMIVWFILFGLLFAMWQEGQPR